MTPDILERLMRAIVPCRLTVASIGGTWKLSQNKPDEVRVAAAAEVAPGIGQELGQLTQLMVEH